MSKHSKRSKRSNGSGAIYRRNDGRWVASIAKPKHMGNGRLYHYSKTRRECEKWLSATLTAIKEDSLTLNSSMILIEWLNIWLQSYCINIASSTRDSYQCYINKHVANHSIASIPLCQVTTHLIQEFIGHLMSSEGRLDGKGSLSPKTVRNIVLMLHAALKQAKGNKLISDNPADYVVLPKVRKPDIHALTIAERERLLSVANGERWQIGIQLSLGLGLRIGELLALHASDLKITEDGIYYLDISKSLKREKDYAGETDGHKTVLHEGSTKTDNSNRQVPLTPALMDLVKAHITRLRDEADKSYGLFESDPYLICNELGDKVDPTTYRNWFNSIVEKSGISGRVTPHTLRHTYASTAVQNGVDVRTVSDVLGHTEISFTLSQYCHSNLSSRYTAMCELEERIFNQKGL